MRIAGRTMVRRYMSNLERNFSRKNDAENKITSNRQYSRGSEDPLSASKAMKVRKAISQYNSYEANLETAKGIYETAESSVMAISELIQNTYSQLIYGANGTQSPDEDKIIAGGIRNYADEMVQLLNVRSADRNIFAGTDNSNPPFRIGDGNVVYYQGVAVNQHQNPTDFPNSGTSYADIGIGMFTGEDGRIDSQSALPVTFNGVEVMGCGLKGKAIKVDLEDLSGDYSFDITANGEKRTIIFETGADDAETVENINESLRVAFGNEMVVIDEGGYFRNRNAGDYYDIHVENSPLLDEDHDDYVEYDQAEINITPTGFSNNIIQLTLDAAACLESGDKLGAAKFADALYDIQTNLSLSIADIGNKEEFIDFNLERVTNSLFTLSEQQNTLEYTDLGTEITTWKVMEAIYNASLQMSASVVPMSIFNFM